MGAGPSAKVDTYEMKMIDKGGKEVVVQHGKGGGGKGGGGGSSPGGKGGGGDKGGKTGGGKASGDTAGKDGKAGKGGKGGKEAAPAAKDQPSAAKQRFLKAKTKLAAGRAFSNAGQSRGKRTKRRANDMYGWIAKDMMCPPSVKLTSFEVQRIIGTGLMGTVKIARYKKDDTWCVLKAVRKDYVSKNAAKNGKHLQNERNILRDCDHPFIVVLFGTFQDSAKVYFVLEYAAGGELFTRLYNTKDGKCLCSAASAKFYLSEILLALEYLHENGYCYRDLKPENIMLDEEGHCKLIDFGFVREVDGDEGKMTTQVGTPCYLSPEQLDAKFRGGYTRIVDWWAFGIITYELMAGKTPFAKNNRESAYAIFTRVLKGKISYPSKFDPLGKEFVSKLLLSDPDKRLKDPKSIRAHSWFSGIDFDAVLDRRLVPPHKPVLSTEPGDVQNFDEYPDEKDTPSQAIDQSLFSDF